MKNNKKKIKFNIIDFIAVFLIVASFCTTAVFFFLGKGLFTQNSVEVEYVSSSEDDGLVVYQSRKEGYTVTNGTILKIKVADSSVEPEEEECNPLDENCNSFVPGSDDEEDEETEE